MQLPSRTTVLVLEDDPNDAILIRRAFLLGASRAFVCRNTSEARAYLLGAGMYGDREVYPFPHLIVTDVRLGDESGIHFLAWVRSKPEFRGLPVVVLSGSATEAEIEEAMALGAAKVLTKPSN